MISIGGRARVAGVAVLLLAPLVAVATQGRGYRPPRIDLAGGGAWLASAQQGLVTLIDGASEQVVGSVAAPGAKRGDALSVVPAGTAAYVVNGTQGTLSRVDGGTYEVSPPIRFADGGRDTLAVFASSTTLYVVDAGRRLASVTDPVTLRRRDQLSLAARPGPGQSMVDDDGRLWVVDSGGAGLVRFAGSDKLVRTDVADGSSRLVQVQGDPVLVDLSRPRLGRLTSDGVVESWSCLDVRPGDKVHLLGSRHSSRVFGVLPAAGTLVAAGVGRDDCSFAVVVGNPGDDLGPPVEAAGFVFVPNRSTGETAVVEVATHQVRKLPVVKPRSRLELMAKDGFVFYNDLDGDQAGVIRFDSGVWRVGRSLKKFSVSDTGKGILTPGGETGGAQQPPTGLPGATKDPGPDRKVPPSPPGGRPPPGGGPAPPAGGPPPPGGGPGPGPTPVGQPVILDITWTPDPIPRWKPATFTAKVRSASGATWQWTLIGEDGTTVHTSSQVGGFTLVPPQGHGTEFLIRLDLTGPGGTATMTKHIDTTSEFHPQISNLRASDPNPAVGQVVTFSASEPVAGPKGRWRWEITDADTGNGLIPPTEHPAEQPFPFTFTQPGRYNVRLAVDFDGAVDEEIITVIVSDRCRLAPVTGSPVDLRVSGSSKPVTVRLVDCFAPQRVTVSAASWLGVSDTGFTLDPDTNGSVTARVDGAPPVDGQSSDALVFRLANGNDARYDILANLAPKWNNYAECLPVVLNGKATFYSDFVDADVSSLDVRLMVGGFSARMEYVNGGPGGHGEFFWLEVPVGNLPNVSTWRVQATDSFGLRSDIGTGNRGTCW